MADLSPELEEIDITLSVYLPIWNCRILYLLLTIISWSTGTLFTSQKMIFLIVNPKIHYGSKNQFCAASRNIKKVYTCTYFL